MGDFENYSHAVLNLALVLPRLAAAFLILPLISNDTMPTMVRNIFLVSLAIAVFPLVGQGLLATTVQGIEYAPLVLKELLIGGCVAFSFSIVFWALEGAGQIIDNKVGSTTAQIVDPLSGHQTSLTGAFMTRFAAYLFVAFGGLLVFLDLLMTSYAVWPITSLLPELRSVGQWFFVERFSDLMRMMLLLASPALALLSLVELGFGYINRYAQQLNVFAMSMPVKGWLSVFVLLLMLGTMIEYVVIWIAEQRNLLEVLKKVFPTH